MFATLLLSCAFAADEPTFNGLTVPEWLAMAKDDPLPRKRKAAVIALGELVTEKTRDAVLTGVARAMRNDSQASVRLQAALVLGQQPAEKLAGYITDLSEGLRQEKDPGVKREIAVNLGRIGKAAQAAVLPLIDALKDAAPVKAAAADALGRIGPGAHSAVPALTPLASDADRNVRHAAVFALGRVDAPDPDAVAATLIGVLASQTASHQAKVTLAALAGGSAARDRDADMVTAAVISLGFLGVKSPESARAIAGQLRDPDPEVRQQAALALAKLTVGAKAAAEELHAALKQDPDKLVRVYASQSLAAALGNEPEQLIAILGEQLKRESDYEVRLAMVEELGALGPAGAAALPVLREVQRDTQAKVREAAALAIRRITKPTPPPMPKP